MPVPPVPAHLQPGYGEAAHPLKSTSCYAACIIDSKTKKVIWSRDKDTPRYPASTTKIMTTLLMLENYQPDDIITGPKDVDKVGESSMHMKPGEKVRVKFLAYALMLRSANDGCYAVAVNMDGSVAAFANRMNKRAKEIGCKNTHFANPNGLNNTKHKISAFDLCLVAAEAMKRDDFREVVRTQKKLIDRSINSKDRWMVNRNKILWKDPSANGIKTGYTKPSGNTYVGSASRNGTEFITSLLHAPKWQDDHMRMLKFAFDNYESRLIEPVGPIDLREVPDAVKCTTELRQDVYACVKKGRDKVESVFVRYKSLLPFKTGDVVGDLVVTDSDNFVQKIPVYATSDEPSGIAAVAKTSTSSPVGIAFMGLFGAAGAGTLLYRATRKPKRTTSRANRARGAVLPSSRRNSHRSRSSNSKR